MTWTMAFSWLLDSPLRAEPDMMFSLGVGGERDTENYGSKLTRRVTWALLHHRIGDTLVLVPRGGANATTPQRGGFWRPLTRGQTNTKVPSTFVYGVRILLCMFA